MKNRKAEDIAKKALGKMEKCSPGDIVKKSLTKDKDKKYLKKDYLDMD